MKIIVGDPHGCLRELQALLSKVGYRQGQDDLVLAGDLLDRGPSPVEVVEYAMGVGARRVKGNHEEKALRWLAYEARVTREPGFRNPMEPQPEPERPAPKQHVSGERPMTPEALALRAQRQAARLARGETAVAEQPKRKAQAPKRPIPEGRKAQWRALSPAQIQWLAESPLWLDLGNGWLVVHAGFEPKPLPEQKADRVIRVRYVDSTGDMAPYVEDSLNQPAGSVMWQQVWTGPQNVVYGHAVHSRRVPRIDVRETPSGPVQMVGIDTGCCFGGRLTAMVFEAPGAPPEFVQVDAERAYVPLPAPVPDEV